jgi:hypothetical protein
LPPAVFKEGVVGVAFLGFYVSDELARRFAAIAGAHGGKSALLRRMVENIVGQSGVSQAPNGVGRSEKVTVRFRQSELALLAEAAAARGMNRTQWISSLVRARLGFGLQLSAGERNELRTITRELNRIGGNINQLARSANIQMREGREVAIDSEVLREAAIAVREAVSEFRTAVGKSAGYWDAPA